MPVSIESHRIMTGLQRKKECFKQKKHPSNKRSRKIDNAEKGIAKDTFLTAKFFSDYISNINNSADVNLTGYRKNNQGKSKFFIDLLIFSAVVNNFPPANKTEVMQEPAYWSDEKVENINKRERNANQPENIISSYVDVSTSLIGLVNSGINALDTLIIRFDPFIFPQAGAHVIYEKKKTTTISPEPDEVKKEKIDHSCAKTNENMSFIEIIRQVGKTLQNPVNEMAKSSLIIHYYETLRKGCPSPKKIAELELITRKVDAVISLITSFLPESRLLISLQTIVGPLFEVFSDEIEGKNVDPNKLNDIHAQTLFIAKSIVDETLRRYISSSERVNLIIPQDISLEKNKVFTLIDNNKWELVYRNERYFAIRNKVQHEVFYADGERKWRFLNERKTNIKTAQPTEIKDENPVDNEYVDDDILCTNRPKRGVMLKEICNSSVQQEYFDFPYEKNPENIITKNSMGTVYNLDNYFVLKEYNGIVTDNDRSVLNFAIQNTKAFNRIYGEKAASVIINDLGNEMASIYVKMRKIEGEKLSDLNNYAEVETLKDLKKTILDLDPAEKLSEELISKGIYLHNIKSESIIFDKKEGFRIIDFDYVTNMEEDKIMDYWQCQDLRKKLRGFFEKYINEVDFNIGSEKINEVDKLIIKKLAIKPETYKHVSSFHVRDAGKTINVPNHNAVYYVTVKGSDAEFICIKIQNRFMPIRYKEKQGIFEVYDKKKPRKAGYPVHIDAENNWVMGDKKDALYKKRSGKDAHPAYLSKRLYNALTENYFERNIDVSTLSSENSHGVTTSIEGKNYLKVGDKYVEMARHPLMEHFFILGPEQEDKIICHYDKKLSRFILVPIEKTFTLSDGHLEKNDIQQSMLDIIADMKFKFEEQKLLKTYREGFRTKNEEEFQNIYLIDKELEKEFKKIYFYGLNEEEFRGDIKYEAIVNEIRGEFNGAYNILDNVHNSLFQVDGNKLREKFFNILRIDSEAQESQSILRCFYNNLKKMKAELRNHIDDELKRVWLVDFTDEEVMGEVFLMDPLRRIFFDLKKSGAYTQYRATRIACKALCAEIPPQDDVATIIHEVSHLATNTDDIFYFQNFHGNRPLPGKINKLFSGDMSNNEAEAIVNTEAAQDRPFSFIGEKALARYLFNKDPKVRSEFLLKNADSFTMMVMELHDEIMRPGSVKRDVSGNSQSGSKVLFLISSQILNHAE